MSAHVRRPSCDLNLILSYDDLALDSTPPAGVLCLIYLVAAAAILSHDDSAFDSVPGGVLGLTHPVTAATTY